MTLPYFWIDRTICTCFNVKCMKYYFNIWEYCRLLNKYIKIVKIVNGKFWAHIVTVPAVWEVRKTGSTLWLCLWCGKQERLSPHCDCACGVGSKFLVNGELCTSTDGHEVFSLWHSKYIWLNSDFTNDRCEVSIDMTQAAASSILLECGSCFHKRHRGMKWPNIIPQAMHLVYVICLEMQNRAVFRVWELLHKSWQTNHNRLL